MRKDSARGIHVNRGGGLGCSHCSSSAKSNCATTIAFPCERFLPPPLSQRTCASVPVSFKRRTRAALTVLSAHHAARCGTRGPVVVLHSFYNLFIATWLSTVSGVRRAA